MRKKDLIAVIDTETTGLSPSRHEVIEIGLILFEQEWKGDKWHINVKEEWEAKLKPENIATADPVSLTINGYSEKAWENAMSQKEGLRELESKITLVEESAKGNTEMKKVNHVILMGHNLAFDFAFLNEAFRRAGVNHVLNRVNIDTTSFARAVLRKEGPMRFSLQALTEHFGIKNDKAHTALSDCRATLELYQKLLEY